MARRLVCAGVGARLLERRLVGEPGLGQEPARVRLRLRGLVQELGGLVQRQAQARERVPVLVLGPSRLLS